MSLSSVLAGFQRLAFGTHGIHHSVPSQIVGCARRRLLDFETMPASREAAQTNSLIDDLDQIVQVINANIAAEEKQAWGSA
jgi:hypothetical protein